jgi:hypothetical protein
MKKKNKNESEALLRSRVAKEMTKPRITKSVREIETNSAPRRIAQLKARKYKLKLLPQALPQGASS